MLTYITASSSKQFNLLVSFIILYLLRNMTQLAPQVTGCQGVIAAVINDYPRCTQLKNINIEC